MITAEHLSRSFSGNGLKLRDLNFHIEKGDCVLGILLCGSGNGMQMTANKHEGIRAGLAWNKEVAELAKQHNNANMISIPARYVSKEEALEIAQAFLNAEFEGGRHQKRVDMIAVK